MTEILRNSSENSRFQDIRMEYDLNWQVEEMTGCLALTSTNGNNQKEQQVQVKVYRTSAEHFAVLYPQKKVCRPLAVINLRNTQVERLSKGFVVRQCGVDTPLCSLTFRTENEDELDRWVAAFSTSKSTHKRWSVPIIEEDEEL